MKPGRVVVVEKPDETELGCPLDVCEGPYSGDAPSARPAASGVFPGQRPACEDQGVSRGADVREAARVVLPDAASFMHRHGARYAPSKLGSHMPLGHDGGGSDTERSELLVRFVGTSARQRRDRRQPAVRASSSEQNQRSPVDGVILVRS